MRQINEFMTHIQKPIMESNYHIIVIGFLRQQWRSIFLENE